MENEAQVVVENIKVGSKKATQIVRTSRNGYGKTIQYGAIKYRSVKAFADAFAKKHNADPKAAYAAVTQRLNANWTPAEIMKEPIRTVNKAGGLAELARKHGMDYNVLYNRIHKLGMSEHDAVTKPVRERSPNGLRKINGVLVETVPYNPPVVETVEEPVVETMSETSEVQEPTLETA